MPVKQENHGKFYSGDSYLIYSSFEPGHPCGVDLKPKPTHGRLEQFIHLWLGSATTQDEAGVIAIKAVELDDFLGGTPVQQREVEGSESKRFLSYFSKGIKLLPGGATSGFKHVTDEFNPVLYSVKGRRAPVVRQLPLSWSSMNSGDVFVIDGRSYIFVWIGRDANVKEKMFGAKLAQDLKGDHGQTSCTIVIVGDNQELALPQEERSVFDALLPLKEKKLKPISEVQSDEKQEASLVNDIILYECSDEAGTLKVVEVKRGPLFQTDLKSENTFIIDNGENGVYVWIGKKASEQERIEALRNAESFAKKKEYANNTKIMRVIDGGEPSEFKSLFKGWKDQGQSNGLGTQYTVGRIAKVEKKLFDASTLHDQPKLAAETGMVDDGSGTKETYRIVDFKLSPVPPKECGKFFAGDCYIINYTYTAGGSERNIIYYWLGSTSGQDEKGAAALQAIELDNQLGGRAVQIRVIQGKEPKHFIAMFGGKLIIYTGGKASAFEKQQGESDEELGSTYLLQVRGASGSHSTRAVQVPRKAASLNSNDVFMLVSPTVNYMWCGKGSSGDERELAKKIGLDTKADLIVIPEGHEKAEFWDLLGGKGDYWNDSQTAEEYQNHEPRLFHCSNATGNLKVEEIFGFNQDDLNEDDVMFLDIGESIFIWIGAKSNKDEALLVEKLIPGYLQSDPTGRDADTTILKIRQGCEPPTFTGFFGVWDPTCWENQSSFEKTKNELRQDNPNLIVMESVKDDTGVYYPMEVLLVRDAELLPSGVDSTCKEKYLVDQDFSRLFGMTREAFNALPKWKRDNAKKAVGIF